MAFSGDSASVSAQTEPSEPSQLRRLASLPASFSQDTVDGHRGFLAPSTTAATRQVEPAPVGADRHTFARPHARQGARLQPLGGATRTATASHASDAWGCSPSMLAAPAAPASTCPDVGSLHTDDSKLAALPSNSPAVLERLRAAARAAPAPAQINQGATLTVSDRQPSEITDSQRRGSHERFDAHQAPEDHSLKAPAPDPAASAAQTGVLCVSSASHRKPVDPRRTTTTTVDGGSSGSPSGSGCEGLAPAAIGRPDGGGGSSPGEALVTVGGSGAAHCDGRGNTGMFTADAQASGRVTHPVCGAGARHGGLPAATAVKEGTTASTGPGARTQEANFAGLRTEGMQQSGRQQDRQSVEVLLAAAAAAAPPSPPDLPIQPQPAEPVSAHLGAALPPEVAARLKKPIRIIQPISKTWVEETLHCTGGVADGGAAAPSSGGKPSGRCTETLIQVPGAVVEGLPQLAQPLAGARQQRPHTAAAAPEAQTAQAWPDASGVSRATAVQQPRELTLRDMHLHSARDAPQAVPVCPTNLATVLPPGGPAAGAADSSPLAALGPALAALASLPLTDAGASPFTLSSLGALLQPAAVPGPSGPGAAAALPRSYVSNTTTITHSAAPTTAGPSPFSSGILPPCSSSGTMRPGAPSDTGMATAGPFATETAAAGRGGGTMGVAAGGGVANAAAEVEVLLAASPAMAALLAGTAAAPINPAAAAATRSSPDVARRARMGAPTGLAPPMQARQQQQRPAASAAKSTSASCLGKVQGELTLLYQWYVANKAAYLEQAQIQLQRIEELTAAHDDAAAAGVGGSAADAAAAACVRAESAEAMRAFETALKIMSVCGRVEQQWLAGPQVAAAAAAVGAPAGGGADQRPVPAAPPASARVPAAGVGAFLEASPAANVGRSLAPDAFTQLHSAVGLPAPSGGWSHGPNAALAVAAALVGSVGRSPAPRPVDSGSRDGAAEAPGAPCWMPSARGVSPPSAIGASPLAVQATGAQTAAGIPMSVAAQGLHAAASDPRLPAAVATVALAPAPLSLPLPHRATAMARPPAVAPVSPLTAV